jgi:hypothetical protein
MEFLDGGLGPPTGALWVESRITKLSARSGIHRQGPLIAFKKMLSSISDRRVDRSGQTWPIRLGVGVGDHQSYS